jgi:PAS domain-containing protein
VGTRMLRQRVIFPHRKPKTVDFEQGHALAQAIVDTVREPLLVLDQNLRVVAASRSFYITFRVNRQKTQGGCCTPWQWPVGHPQAPCHPRRHRL